MSDEYKNKLSCKRAAPLSAVKILFENIKHTILFVNICCIILHNITYMYGYDQMYMLKYSHMKIFLKNKTRFTSYGSICKHIFFVDFYNN